MLASESEIHAPGSEILHQGVRCLSGSKMPASGSASWE